MSFERYWPEWPPSTKGSTLVLVKAHCAVDALFAHVFGYGSTFQVSTWRFQAGLGKRAGDESCHQAMTVAYQRTHGTGRANAYTWPTDSRHDDILCGR
jgi:hypothetical protein